MPQVGLIKDLARIVGGKCVLTAPEDLVCYSYDATPDRFVPDVVVCPSSAEEISRILKLANRECIPVVPRGAGTNLSGGSVPVKGGIVLSLERMNKVIEVDLNNLTATVQACVVTGEFHKLVESEGLFYPPDPASMSVSTMGGNVAENAGGPRGFKYGTTRDYVLGLQVVLPTGEIIKTGGKTIKNVTGFDLTRLFVGSEGTLGAITEITVRLIPKPPTKRTVLAVFDRIIDGAQAVTEIVKEGIVPAALELVDRETMKVMEEASPAGLPVTAEGILLFEVDGWEEVVGRQIRSIAEICKRAGSREVCVAYTDAEADTLWTARRKAYGAIAKLRPTCLVEDATVPRDKIPEMVQKIDDIRKEYRVTVALVGHVGDGNLHPAFLCDKRDEEEMARVREAIKALFRATIELGGTLSGEHGIGLTKAGFLDWELGRDGVELMRKLKQALDPKGILNPGKMQL